MNDDQNVRIYDEITLFQKRRTFMMLFIASTIEKGDIEPEKKEEEKEEKEKANSATNGNEQKMYTHPYIMKSISQIAASDVEKPEEQVEQYHLHKDKNHKVLIDSNKKNIQDKNDTATLHESSNEEQSKEEEEYILEKPSKEEDIFLEMAHNIINNDDAHANQDNNLNELVESWNTIMPDKYSKITVKY